jgi:hypothetical protein
LGPPCGCGKGKKALQEEIDKRLIVDLFSASKSKSSDLGHKNDVHLTMLTQLGDAVNKSGTVFAEHMEHQDKFRDNDKDMIECLKLQTIPSTGMVTRQKPKPWTQAEVPSSQAIA